MGTKKRQDFIAFCWIYGIFLDSKCLIIILEIFFIKSFIIKIKIFRELFVKKQLETGNGLYHFRLD